MRFKLLPMLIGAVFAGQTVSVIASPIVDNASSKVERTHGAPTITHFQLASISDVAAQFTWQDSGEDNRYEVTLIERPENASPIAYLNDAEESGFYRGHLTPETEYEAVLKVCNEQDCTSESFTFTTLPSRLAYNDARKAVNHLTGNLSAHINFAQTHTSVTPSGNDENARPNLIMKRNALLLVTPKAYWTNHLWLEVLEDGVVVDRVAMTPPSAQPKTDQRDSGRSEVVFSHHAWSAPINWQWMKPGLSLRLSDNFGRTGELPETEIVFGGAPELVIQNIDIGMLTTPRNQYQMIDEMNTLAADYFQKIPTSKLVVADYTPFHLTKVTLPNGKVYTEHSDDEGGVYGGDMREAIGKALVSTGINNANFGITDTAGYSQGYNRRTNHITAHNNRGVYTNGIVNHGLSGGGGIVTLSSSVGNEWSHELGHNYGRGHWPTNASSHDLTTGWGWDAFYNRFIGNLHWSGEATTNEVGGQIVPPFAGEYRYTRDAMAGGESAKLGLVSRYTLEHPTGTKVTQNWLNAVKQVNLDSSTGYTEWDQETQRYVESDVDYSAPIAHGVPVITVLGIYDPLNINPSQIYPLTYSNYGNVFELPKPTNVELQLEGWQNVANLTEFERSNTQWQTMIVDGEWLPLCQFSYTNANGEQANFIGYEDSENDTCRTTNEMYWSVNGQRELPVSAVGDYLLLASKGDLVGSVTYTPTAALGEQTLCSLNKGGTAHDGAGFLADGRCKQIDNVKHINGANWAYAAHQGGIMQYALASQKQCQLNVTYAGGEVEEILLAGARHGSDQSNKFHLNLDASQHPTNIAIECRDGSGEISVLDSLNVAPSEAVEQLSGPVIIGQEYGYEAAKSDLPTGWFKHTESFDPAALKKADRSKLATLLKGDERPYLCRFPMQVSNTMKVLHGYVEEVSSGQFQCTGGSEITVRDDQGERPVLSQINQFEWLSLLNFESVGQRVKATDNSDKNLCSLTAGNEFYGAGFVNDSGQCVQEPEVYWSNGRQWVFSNRHGQYSYY
ncbi:hypothetical protein VA249_31250 [Vibrio alfacsensis]|uniref:M66 family metalloprotease n=1 Tax=Vibrio alfacsensis TaxID=1074311 RepID=UPI001BEF2DE2|nr:M66 family metalloprotease [Vibrio alfacsensis]BBM66479.1 hypothetical protein VA249_31250 [Vibrio alfacsensis]